jgi:hypothetical protein
MADTSASVIKHLLKYLQLKNAAMQAGGREEAGTSLSGV